MYVCTPDTIQIRKSFLPTQMYPPGAEFFSSPWMILVFYVYNFFLIFIAKGGVVDGVCYAPTAEGGKNCHSLLGTYMLLACRLCATTNFIIILSGLFFHWFFCVCSSSLCSSCLNSHTIPYTLNLLSDRSNT